MVHLAQRIAAETRRSDRAIVYCVDLIGVTFLAALSARLAGFARLVVDSGDALFFLARTARLRGPAGLLLTAGLEVAAQRIADLYVVRGTNHRNLIPASADVVVVQDGFDAAEFAAPYDSGLRSSLGLHGTVVGLVGTLSEGAERGLGYGWELVRLLAEPGCGEVMGLIVGDGPGRAGLECLADATGVADRIRFTGFVERDNLPQYIRAMDVCLSTQTNDIAGSVRTTGKLPLYLAAGRPVLATRVGEAARVLPEWMLVKYRGVADAAYPSRLAARLLGFMRGDFSWTPSISTAIAAQFEYDRLASRLEVALGRLWSA